MTRPAGVLAYAKKLDPGLLKLVTGESGVEPTHRWFGSAEQGILNKNQRKYESQLSQMILDGTEVKRALVPNDAHRLNFFRSWHWFYRFQTPTRLSGAFQTAM